MKCLAEYKSIVFTLFLFFVISDACAQCDAPTTIVSMEDVPIAKNVVSYSTKDTIEVNTSEGLAGAVINASDGDVIRLTADIELKRQIGISSYKSVVIDLNGSCLKAAAGRHVFYVYSIGELTIIDGNHDVTHYYTVDDDGLWNWNDANTANAVELEELNARPEAGTVIAVKGGAITGTNLESDMGGAIVNYGTLVIQNANIIGNRTRGGYNHGEGSGIFVGDSGNLTCDGSNICGNFSCGSGGGIMNQGSAMLRNTRLSFNKCVYYGGGIMNNGKKIAEDNNGTGTLEGCEIIGNYALFGGGIHNGWRTILKGNNNITGNTAKRIGGGISGYGSWGYNHEGLVTIEGRNLNVTGNICIENPQLGNYALETAYGINLIGNSTLGNSRINIGQFKYEYEVDPPTKITLAGYGSGVSSDVEYFISENPEYRVRYNQIGPYLELTEFPHEHVNPVIESVNQENMVSCSCSKTFSFTLFNDGIDSFSSMVYRVEIGDSIQEFEWTGTLEPDAAEEITFDMTIPFGKYVSSLNIIRINGKPFEYEVEFMAECEPWIEREVPGKTAVVDVLINQDQNGMETTWKIRNSSNDIVACGGPYPYLSDEGGTMLHFETFNEIPVGDCYSFVIDDANDNGICCLYGEGWFKIRVNGEFIIGDGEDNGDFGRQAKAFFSLKNGNSVGENTAENINIYPNPANSTIFVEGENIKSVEIYNSLGQMVAAVEGSEKTTVNVASFDNGVYFVKVVANDGAVKTQKVTIAR